MGRSERWQYRSLYLTRLALDRRGRRARRRRGAVLHAQHLRRSRPDRGLPRDASARWRTAATCSASASCWSTRSARLFQRHGSGRTRIKAPPRDRILLARVIERMRAEYATDLRLEDLAASVGLTTFQLIGLFKRTVGLTPHAYLTQVRLGMACRHLRHSPVLAEVGDGGRLLRPERAQQALQALLRHHAAAVRAGGARRRQFSPIRSTAAGLRAGNASLLS